VSHPAVTVSHEAGKFGQVFRMARLSSYSVDFDETVADMTTTSARVHGGAPLPVLVSCLLTRRRVIDQMRTSSATCR
jgi:hypothetical protein